MKSRADDPRRVNADGTPLRDQPRVRRRPEQGQDTRTGVALLEQRYDPPFRFTGKINKMTFRLEPEQTVGVKQ
jgi:hypothetical protein